MNNFIDKTSIINALTQQTDKRLKSVNGNFTLEVSYRIDTDYWIEFPIKEIFINRLSVQKNAYGVQLLIGEKYTKFGTIRYNIQSISVNDWEIVKANLK